MDWNLTTEVQSSLESVARDEALLSQEGHSYLPKTPEEAVGLIEGLDAEVDMELICLLTGGPERVIIDGKGKKWRFEDHHYCGPTVLAGKTGEIAETQPPENSPFWDAVNLWYAQGKRTTDTGKGEVWCKWDKPTVQKMRHLGGNHYQLITD